MTVEPSMPSGVAPATVARLAGGSATTVLGKFLGRGFQLLTQVFLARALGPLQFGVFTLAWTLFRLASILGTAGFDKAMTPIRFRERRSRPARWRNGNPVGPDSRLGPFDFGGCRGRTPDRCAAAGRRSRCARDHVSAAHSRAGSSARGPARDGRRRSSGPRESPRRVLDSGSVSTSTGARPAAPGAGLHRGGRRDRARGDGVLCRRSAARHSGSVPLSTDTRQGRGHRAGSGGLAGSECA